MQLPTHLGSIQRVKDTRVTIAFLIVSLALVCAAIWAYHSFITSPPFVDPDRYPIRGIDISRHNGMMNLDAAAADGIDFVFIKASEGTTLRDPNFRINYDKASHAGLKIGAYHFFKFDQEGIPQAKNFLNAIGDHHLDLHPVIDFEKAYNHTGDDPEIIKQRLIDMADYLNLSGYSVIVYTNKESYEMVRDALPGTSLWICSFNRIPIDAEWTFWQYDHHGRVAGIRGDVDLNAFVGSREDWQKYLTAGTL
ncbi:MAG: hypothetical protein K2H86_07615 [Muribaculaceae bacterium]|nr:hypothetical protein [Muribaculaceae bacterium]